MVLYNTQAHSDVKWVSVPAKVVMCETHVGLGFQFFRAEITVLHTCASLCVKLESSIVKYS
jgi:hypothetical protein